MESFKKFFKWADFGYRTVTGIIIYVGSYLLAVSVFTKLLISGNAIYLFVFAGLLGSLINYLLYHFFSNRYHYWYLIQKKDSQSNSKKYFLGLMILPPVSTFFMSLALTVYGASLFIPTFKNVWEDSLEQLPDIAGTVTEIIFQFVGEQLFALIFFGTFLLILIGALKIFGESKLAKNIIYGTLIVGTPILLVWFLVAFDGGDKMNQGYKEMQFFVSNNIFDHIRNYIIVLLGFVPIHWIYELFIAPFRRKNKEFSFPKVSSKKKDLYLDELEDVLIDYKDVHTMLATKDKDSQNVFLIVIPKQNDDITISRLKELLPEIVQKVALKINVVPENIKAEVVKS
jgi:hypothetical protein